ncbi:MAG: RNA pseudouridine synthase [Verrucomicrobia bacterium]|nr:RNA pseudouridine synthase [Verrucomicrobiota bacterium]
MEVIYCDNHLLVVVKPAGLSTQPHLESADNLLDQAKAYLKKRFDKKGAVFLEPVHRLDKPVSGLVLFARTSKALSRLQESMRAQAIEKTYYATVEGSLPEEAGTLEHFLFHDDHRARIVSASHPEGKRARLHYKVIKKEAGKTFLEIVLETGRYHQIRAQLSAAHCPIFGDQKYGSTHPWKKGAIALYHGRMRLMHPVTQEPLSFQVALD